MADNEKVHGLIRRLLDIVITKIIQKTLFSTWKALIKDTRKLYGSGSRAKPLPLFDAGPDSNQRGLIDPIAGQFVKIHFQAVKWRVDDYDSRKPK